MRVINDTLVLCLSPPLSGGDVKASTSVEVELSLSDGHGALSFPRSGLRFDYAREPELVSAEPALGPVTGNTEVLLAVRFLRLPVAGEAEAAASRGAGSPLLCAFGEVGSATDQAARVPAALAVRTAPGGEPSRGEWAANSDISLVSCVAPAALNSTETGIVPVRFSQNYGADWSLLTGVTFEYQRAPTLLDLSPRFGPAMAGGTAVRVTGSGFVDRAGLSCRVDGNYVVPAQFLSGTGVVCRVPPLLALGGGATPAGSLPRALRIEVSNDGRSFFLFFFYRKRHVLGGARRGRHAAHPAPSAGAGRLCAAGVGKELPEHHVACVPLRGPPCRARAVSLPRAAQLRGRLALHV